MSWSAKTGLRERSARKLGDMEHWNQFLQSVLTDAKQDKNHNSTRKSEDKEAGLTNKLTSKKGVKNE